MNNNASARARPNRLSQRLTLTFMLLAVVPMVVGGLFAITVGTLYGEQEISNRQQMVITLGQTLIEQYLDNILNDLHSAGLLALHDPEHLDTTLVALCAQAPEMYLELTVADAQGNEMSRLHSCTPFPRAALGNRAEYEPFFRAKRGETYIGDVSFLIRNEPVIRVSHPISYDGQIVIVLARVNLKELWEPLNQLYAGEGGYFYLTDRHGNLAAYRDLNLVREGRSLSTFPTVSHPLQDVTTVTTARYRGLLGNEVIGSSATIKQARWVIVVEQPRTEAFAIQQRLILGFILLTAVAGALGVEIALNRARSIVRPIQQLARGAEAIASGDFTHMIPVTSDDEVGAVSEAFNSMSVRLGTLIEDLQQRIKELTLLHAVAQAGVEAETTTALLERIITIVERTYRPARFGAMLYDEATERLYVPLPHLLPAGMMSPSLVPGEGVTGQVFLTGKAQRIADVLNEPDYLPLLGNTRAELCVPLIVGTQRLGILNAESDAPNAFSEDDERLLTIVAGQVATALARLYATEAEARRVRQLAALYDVGKRITSILDLDTLLNEIVRLAAQALEAYNIEIALLEGTTLVFQAGYGGYTEVGFQARETMPISKGLMGCVARTGRPLLASDVAQTPDYVPYPPLPDVHAELSVPLQVQGKIIGVLDIKSNQINGIAEADIAIIEILADQVAIAIQNARLFAAQQRQLQELQALHALALAGAGAIHADTIIELTTACIGELLHPTHYGILLIDDTTNTLRFHASYHGLASHTKDIPLGQGITGWVALSGQPRRVSDTHAEPLYISSQPITRSELCVPLKARDTVLGVLNAEHTAPNAFTAADEQLLLTLAGQLATVIQKLQLFAETEEALAREQRLNEVSRIISGALDLPTLLANVTRLAAELVGADAGGLSLLAPDAQSLVMNPLYSFNLPSKEVFEQVLKGEGLSWQILEERTSVLLPDYTSHPQALPQLRSSNLHGFIGVPVNVGETSIGVLGLFKFQSGVAFSGRDLALTESVGRQAGIAIQNARLFTEAQQRAEELATALEQLKELDKMKNEFIQNVSHELRTPLAIVRGYAELLVDGQIGDLDPDQQNALEIIARRTRMLTEMVEDITLILGAETRMLELAPLSIEEIAKAAVNEFQSTIARAGLHLQAEIETGLPLVKGAYTHLRRVMDNLIGNAVKFTGQGGIICVQVWSTEQQVYIEVSDTGIGIAPEQQERIFQRFYQVDGSSRRRYGGVGLGLALVKEITELHDGHIQVRSTPGKGSTFTIILPALQEV